MKNVHPSHRLIKNFHPFPPTQNILPHGHTHVHLHIKHVHIPPTHPNYTSTHAQLPIEIVHPPQPTQNITPPTPTHPQKMSTHTRSTQNTPPPIPTSTQNIPLKNKKCPTTPPPPHYLPRINHSHPHSPMNNVHSHKIYVSLTLQRPRIYLQPSLLTLAKNVHSASSNQNNLYQPPLTHNIKPLITIYRRVVPKFKSISWFL